MKHRIDIKSLKVLAKHLLTGKLGHKKFDFSSYNANEESAIQPYGNICGTNGCAIGELPFAFPKKFLFDGSGVRKIGEPYSISCRSGLFGLTDNEFGHLFYPNDQIKEWSKNKRNFDIDGTATKKRVANNILYFCELVEQGKIDQ